MKRDDSNTQLRRYMVYVCFSSHLKVFSDNQVQYMNNAVLIDSLLLCLKEVSSAQQGYIYLIKNAVNFVIL